MYNDTLTQIENAALPEFRARIRQWPRKEWAAEVRSLLKALGIKGISVTTPSYSMASSIDIRLPRNPDPWDDSEHKAKHEEIDHTEIALGGYHTGYNQSCPFCKRERQAKDKLETIILAAFPDLDDRSDSRSDHFDSCFTIN